MVKHEFLTSDQERELSKKIQAGDEDAMRELVSHNFLFAKKMSLKFGRDLDHEDSFQAALEGTIYAAKKFDPDKGRFTTFATFYIRREIENLRRKSKAIILSAAAKEKLISYLKDPNSISKENAKALKKTAFVDSLNRPTYDSEGNRTELIDHVEELIDFEIDLVSYEVQRAIGKLDQNEQFLIKAKYGLTKNISLIEAGNQIGISAKARNKIIAAAEEKLRFYLG